jgi:hypothetical protein
MTAAAADTVIESKALYALCHPAIELHCSVIPSRPSVPSREGLAWVVVVAICALLCLERYVLQFLTDATQVWCCLPVCEYLCMH